MLCKQFTLERRAAKMEVEEESVDDKVKKHYDVKYEDGAVTLTTKGRYACRRWRPCRFDALPYAPCLEKHAKKYAKKTRYLTHLRFRGTPFQINPPPPEAPLCARSVLDNSLDAVAHTTLVQEGVLEWKREGGTNLDPVIIVQSGLAFVQRRQAAAQVGRDRRHGQEEVCEGHAGAPRGPCASLRPCVA